MKHIMILHFDLACLSAEEACAPDYSLHGP